ncbi:hypothetical protein [Corynebacterium doosanense]|uniref:3-methyladenine DNA glycosylase n=1 Tax=Corynebacterium doosanense CAU 212 = DSM 45436 TaxID=558173 RepID=A0A097IFY9_9CORY|nr:hypothetical protein [Corynebacterium doosanense]AIT61053.1 3-methyladenine DNA glycosylase [Corynebacterium doosanense CAU 212 = DSM 45436]
MILEPDDWLRRQAHHEAEVDLRTSAHLERRQHHTKHPVYDFLFEYYPVRPAHLRRWHPGVEDSLHDPDGLAPHPQWRNYMRDGDFVSVDLAEFWFRRGSSLTYMRDLMATSATNAAQFDCFGLHEWAMVYQGRDIRHDLPLRLSPEDTDEVVRSHRLKCTHFDAYRFFTPPARPLNLTVLTREDQPQRDQPGCVHATMDLYKWAAKLGPLVPGELFLETFDLALDARILDMEASPYDCRALGFGAVCIETPEGKAEYVRRQRALAERAEPLRARLVALVDAARNATLTG